MASNQRKRNGLLITSFSPRDDLLTQVDELSLESPTRKKQYRLRQSSPSISLNSIIQNGEADTSGPSFRIYSTEDDTNQNMSADDYRLKTRKRLAANSSSNQHGFADINKENKVRPGKRVTTKFRPISTFGLKREWPRNSDSPLADTSFKKSCSREQPNVLKEHQANLSTASSSSIKRLSPLSLSSSLSSRSAGSRLKSMAERFRRSTISQNSLDSAGSHSYKRFSQISLKRDPAHSLSNSHHHHHHHHHHHNDSHNDGSNCSPASNSLLEDPSSCNTSSIASHERDSIKHISVSPIVPNRVLEPDAREQTGSDVLSSEKRNQRPSAVYNNIISAQQNTSKDLQPVGEAKNHTIQKKSSRFHLRHSISLRTLASIGGHSDAERAGNGHSSRSSFSGGRLTHRLSLTNIGRLLHPSYKSGAGNRASINLSSCDISLPIPQHDTREKLNHKLRNSSSILSISSFISDSRDAQTTQSALEQKSVSTASKSITGRESNAGRINIKVPAMKVSEVESINQKLLLRLCNQKRIFSFTSLYRHLARNDKAFKCLSHTQFSDIYAEYANTEEMKLGKEPESVYKVIPFGDNHTQQMQMKEVIQELSITMAMTKTPGFVEIRMGKVVRGPYPSELQMAWESNSSMGGENVRRPSENPNMQLYFVMRMEYAGVSLEKFKVRNWREAYEILKQVCDALSAGELNADFEHRDLHWGNVLVRRDPTLDKVHVSLIDFSLSRARIGDHVLFTGLDNPNFFRGRGDYQFTTYTNMRKLLSERHHETFGNTSSARSVHSHQESLYSYSSTNGDMCETIDWSVKCPSTNLLWIHYLLDRMINHKGLRPIKVNPISRSSRSSISGDKDMVSEVKCCSKIMDAFKCLNTDFKKNKHRSKRKSVKCFSDFKDTGAFSTWFHELD
ncbi:hypothetical protein BRETT_002841 [Brettanomyces bruxellensis]|uniref:non-specific serine/threonine protein kinase n=1 Tax=Dekkera bruxellensis TaxID=5007 RepID=A0A871R9V7_DEKBR|nr:uncharacterized protein BRETT_002841 [Brettanomyces bruxellensis]QOU22659.1 hypothetical protein BRETT_002841 [Brettanomyces bruxellensis]